MLTSDGFLEQTRFPFLSDEYAGLESQLCHDSQGEHEYFMFA